MRRIFLLGAGLLLWLVGAAAPAARADLFGPSELVSASAVPGGLRQQAEAARFPAISANGRYLTFVGRFGGVEGIWRRDLLTGAVEQVAPGVATMPSISADGRYVSFTTNEQLVPQDTNDSPDVYVRDMEPGEGEPEYTLASAVNGSEEGASYTYTGESSSTEPEREFGSVAGARSAISADGELVVFVTTSQSNLLGGSEPTPPFEVFVRDLATDETRLVSAEYQPGVGWGADRPVQPALNSFSGKTEYGAVFPGGTVTPSFGTAEAAPPSSDGEERWLGASISADGSSVAWIGQDLGSQVQLLPGEQNGEPASVAEPLWRRIDEGPGAPVRRVTGGSDPESPVCVASGEQAIPEELPSPLDPCSGPFERFPPDPEPEGLEGSKAGHIDFVPQLSANGETVVFVTGARELASGELQFQGAEESDDLYVVNMQRGLTRVQALTRLTQIGGGGGTQEKIEKSAVIVDYAVSADGSQIAFTTQRTQFPLGAFTYVSPVAAVPGMIELFDLDLDNGTLTRVTHGFEGEDFRSEELPKTERPGEDPYKHEEGAYAPSFSEDGNTLSFADTANNLVYGDGNEAPDVFVAHRLQPVAGEVRQLISSAPPAPVLAPPWKLGVTAKRLVNGSVRLEVVVPGAGQLTASARASILVHSIEKGTRRSARADSGHTRLTTRQVSSARDTVGEGSEGLVPLTLTLSSHYLSLARIDGGLPAIVKLTFSSPGRPSLEASLRLKFVRELPLVKSQRRESARRRPYESNGR
jgi:Tol biopolymer transport system component